VCAPGPAAGPSHAILQLFLGPANSALARLLLLGILDPANELVAGQGRDVLPGDECRLVADQRRAQVSRQLVHDPAGDSWTGHDNTVATCRASNLPPARHYRRRRMDGDQAQQVEEARLVLDARKELYGETDPATLDAMLTLARVLRDVGSHTEAESLLRTSLSIQNRSSDKDAARITRTEFDLAIVLDRLGEADAARHLWEKVLTTADGADGPESQLSRQAATNLAITLRKLGRYGDEFPLRVRILESTRSSLGPDHLDTARSMVDLAQTQRSLGNHEMALDLFVEAVDGLQRGGEEPRTILYQKWAIASELMALKRPKEASLMFDQVVAGAVAELAPDDPFRKSAVRQQRAYRLLGRFSGFRTRSKKRSRSNS
jgi:tetratricopeptide (TPR) repeat protein